MSSTTSLFRLIYETKPAPEMANPEGWLGAWVQCLVKAASFEEAEPRAREVLQRECWDIVAEIDRKEITRGELNDNSEALAYFDHAMQYGVSVHVTGWDEEDSAGPNLAPVSDPLTAKMISCAELATKGGAESGFPLDYSETSLGVMDLMIPELHPDGASFDTTYLMYAGYVGEVIRRNLGGKWKENKDSGLSMEGANFKADPLKWVRDKFADPANESLAFRYKAVKQLITGSGSDLSSTAPAAVLVAPAVAGGSDTSGSKALYQAPLVVFLLVAAADGSIDAKEAGKFKQIIAGIRRHPNRLFKVSIQAMLADFDGNFKEVAAESLIGWVAMLADARQAAELIAPQDSKGFAKALYDLGESVAKSSGGIFGFGGVGKQEKAALSMLSGMLGLEG